MLARPEKLEPPASRSEGAPLILLALEIQLLGRLAVSRNLQPGATQGTTCQDLPSFRGIERSKVSLSAGLGGQSKSTASAGPTRPVVAGGTLGSARAIYDLPGAVSVAE